MAKVIRRSKPTSTLEIDPTSQWQMDIHNKIATVPSREKYLDGYVNQTIKGQLDFDILLNSMRRKHNVKIKGPAGCGKTRMAMAFAAYMNMAFYAVGSTSGTEGSQLNGRIIPDEERDGGFVWQDGPLTDIIRYGGVLLINEIDFLSERFTTHLFQVLDERREIALLDHKGEVIHAPDNFLVIADHNGTDARYRGTRQLNAALADRFAVKLNLDYNPDVEAKIVSSPTLRSIVADLRVQAKEGIIETPISTRMMMEFEEIALDLGTEFAIDNFLNAFDDDVRAPIEHTMNLRSNELMRDIARLVVRTEATVTKPTQDEWLGDEEFATYSDDQFYTPAELDGIGYEELVRRAKLTDFDEDEIDAMDSATLVNFLCGKHEYWDADVTVGA